jgi:hypothetical protein
VPITNVSANLRSIGRSNHDRVEFEEEGKCILSSAEETKATAKERFVRHAELESCQDMSEYMLSTLECLHVGVKKGKLVRLC